MNKSICFCVPSLVSEFSNAFVDFVVGGQVLGCETNFPPVGKGWYEYYPESKLPPAKPLVSQMKGVEKIFAIGDIHGDLAKAKKALYLASLIDNKGKWTGGDMVLVQLGDIFDRGGDEIKIMYMLEKLKRQAIRDGGDVHILNGNHEFMNSSSLFLNTSKGGIREFCRWKQWYKIGEAFKRTCDHTKYSKLQSFENETIDRDLSGRIEALRPGGPFAVRFFANHPVVLIVGNTVFVHAGLTTKNMKGLTPEEINKLAKTFFEGNSGPKYEEVFKDSSSMVWTRDFDSIKDDTGSRCHDVKEVFKKLNVDRIVVGHSVQEEGHITHRCSKNIFLIDVGMSKGVRDTDPEVLEIYKDRAITIHSFGSTTHFASGTTAEYLKKVPRRELKIKSVSLDSSLELKDDSIEKKMGDLKLRVLRPKDPKELKDDSVEKKMGDLKLRVLRPKDPKALQGSQHVGLAVALPSDQVGKSIEQSDTAIGTKSNDMDINNTATPMEIDANTSSRVTRSMTKNATTIESNSWSETPIHIPKRPRSPKDSRSPSPTPQPSKTLSETPVHMPKRPNSPRNKSSSPSPSPRSSISPRKREREDTDPDYSPWQRAKISRSRKG